MSTITRKQLFTDWLGRFPLVDPPITLGEDTHQVFTEQSMPLAQALTDMFIAPYEAEGVIDEFTEYIPCFRIEHQGEYHVCVYWRASLLTYVYFLVTFSHEGEQIDRTHVAGLYLQDGELVQKVVHVEQDLRMICIEGRTTPDAQDFDLASSVRTVFHLSTDGKFVFDTPSDR